MISSHVESIASKCRISKLWLDVVIKPVFIMMLYVRAEREGDWPLHLEAVELMMPYFFASGHVNYSQFGQYYLRSMKRLPIDVARSFLKGEHVMHHNKGIWNRIWSDMFIETTFMRYGHGKRGMIGITLKPETMKVWSLNLHVCAQIQADIAGMCDKDVSPLSPHHKEEMKSRIAADARDRLLITKKLSLCIDPLKSVSVTDCLINIVRGKLAPVTVNVDNAILLENVK